MKWLWAVSAAALVACAAKSSTTSSGGSGEVLTGAGGSTMATTVGSSSKASTASSGSGTSSSQASSSSAASSGAGGSTCKDLAASEPNQSEAQAFKLKGMPIADCDGEGGMETGVVKGTDVDWYTYQGNDNFGCTVDPTRTLNPTDKGLRLCKYLECLNGLGNTEFTCPGGTTSDQSPDGRPGCCGTAGFKIDVNCKGSADDVTHVYIRIDVPGANAATCVNYSLAYHY